MKEFLPIFSGLRWQVFLGRVLKSNVKNNYHLKIKINVTVIGKGKETKTFGD